MAARPVADGLSFFLLLFSKQFKRLAVGLEGHFLQSRGSQFAEFDVCDFAGIDDQIIQCFDVADKETVADWKFVSFVDVDVGIRNQELKIDCGEVEFFAGLANDCFFEGLAGINEAAREAVHSFAWVVGPFNQEGATLIIGDDCCDGAAGAEEEGEVAAIAVERIDTGRLGFGLTDGTKLECFGDGLRHESPL